MKQTRVKPLHSLIFQREIGQYKSLINHCADIYKALLLSERRVYMREMEYNSQGNVNYEDGHLFAENEKKYFNITDGNYQHFEFPSMNMHEKVVATLAYACGDFCQIAKAHYRFLIILTSFGRLIFYDYSKHKIAYCFHLPADKYKFKKLEWNRENHSFWISGAEREPGEERTQGRRGKTHVVVVFEVDPVKFRAMFEVDSQNFGYKTLSNIGLVNDLLFIWDSQPYRVIGFNFEELYRNTTQEIFEPYKGANTNQILPITMRIDEPVIPLFILKGSYQIVGFAGLPYHLFATPASSKANFILLSIKEPHAKPIMNQCSLKRPELGKEIAMESVDAFFHADESGSFYRFEGNEMICYQMKRRQNSNECEFVVNWRNELWKNTVENVRNNRTLRLLIKCIVEGKDLSLFLHCLEEENSDDEEAGVTRNRRGRSYMNEQPSTSRNRPSQIIYGHGVPPVSTGVRTSARIRSRVERGQSSNLIDRDPLNSQISQESEVSQNYHEPDEREDGLSYDMLTAVRRRVRTQPMYCSLAVRMESPFMVIREVMLDTWMNTLVVSVACDLSSLLGNQRSPYILRVPMLAMILILDNMTGELLKIIPLTGSYIEGSAAYVTLEDHLLVYGQKERSKSQYNVFRMAEIGVYGDEKPQFKTAKMGADKKKTWGDIMEDPYEYDEFFSEWVDEDFNPSLLNDSPPLRRYGRLPRNYRE